MVTPTTCVTTSRPPRSHPHALPRYRHRDRGDECYPPLSDSDGSGRAVLDPDDAADDIEALIFGDELHGEIAGLDGDKSGATHPIARDDFLRRHRLDEAHCRLVRVGRVLF